VATQALNFPIDPGTSDPDRRALLDGQPVEDRRLCVAGVDTAILEGGKGPSLILLHGPGEFAPRWFRVLPALTSSFHVVAPDFPDHGASHVLEGALDEKRILDWLDALIRQTCGSEPPILLGHLLGGAVAARFTIAHPGAIQHLFLVDSFGLSAFRPSPRFALALLRYVVRPNDRSYDRFMQQCLVDPNRVADDLDERWGALRRYALNRSRDRRVKKAMRTFMSTVGVPPITPAALASIKAPTTLVWGRQDRALSVRIAETASARYGWPLHVIDGAADDAPMEQPDALVAAIRRGIAER